jgi:hypothetical protein
MNHQYNIDAIIGWLKDGALWFILAIAGLAFLVVVPTTPPAWWYEWDTYSNWFNGSDAAWHPGADLGWRYMLYSWRLLGRWVDESASFAATAWGNFFRAVIGTLPSWAGSVAGGLTNLLSRIGEGVLVWASNALDAAQWLFNRLPDEIKYAGLSWSQLFTNAENVVKAWVATTYATAVSWASTAFGWITNQGTALVVWHNNVFGWIDDIQHNFVARVASALGSPWPWLSAFSLSAGPWLSSLFANHHADLSAFLADPGAWIKARLEAELTRIW